MLFVRKTALCALCALLCLSLPCSALFLMSDPAPYQYTGSFANGRAAVRTDGRWGAVDQTGALCVDPVYSSPEELPVQLPETPETPPLYSGGLAVTYDLHTGLYGYTDENGHVAIAPRYQYAAAFCHGFARVMRDGLWGYIDTRGFEVIPPTYLYARDFDEAGAWVQAGTSRMLLSLDYARQCAAAFQDSGLLYAFPSDAHLLADGRPVTLEAYEIGGSNYIRLRDCAMLLSGLDKGFSVDWDAQARVITVESGGGYTPVGGELSLRPRDSRLAVFTPASVLWDGREMALCAYEIEGSNFFRLRDLMALLDISVTWDAQQSRIALDTAAPYEGAAPWEKPPEYRRFACLADAQRLFDGNQAGQVSCLYSVVEMETGELPAGLYGTGVYGTAGLFDAGRSFSQHLSALNDILRPAFGLSLDRDGVLYDAQGTACLSVLHDGDRFGLSIHAWRHSLQDGPSGAAIQNAALEIMQYLCADDELGAAVWSFVDALQLQLQGQLDDFGFTQHAEQNGAGSLTYRTGRTIGYDMRTDGEITFWF